MSQLLLNETAAPSTPAAGKVLLYADNSVVPAIRAKDDAGLDVALFGLQNRSVAAQVLAVARTYLIGSALAMPVNKAQIGTCFEWLFDITKTAAGLAAGAVEIAVGTLGTTGDTNRCNFVKPAGTAVIDNGYVRVNAVLRGPLATATLAGHFHLTHNLAATGHAVIPVVDVTTIGGAFDATVANLIFGICVTGGAADAVTVQLVQSRAWNV